MIASLILALYLWGVVSAPAAGLFLYLTGTLLLVGELFVTTFGIVALNGLLSLYVAHALYSGSQTILGLPLDWPFVFGIAFVEFGMIACSALVILRFRRKKVTTGIEAMIGAQAKVIEWKGSEGSVRAHGEIWKAESSRKMNLKRGEIVVIEAVDGLTLKISV